MSKSTFPTVDQIGDMLCALDCNGLFDCWEDIGRLATTLLPRSAQESVFSSLASLCAATAGARTAKNPKKRRFYGTRVTTALKRLSGAGALGLVVIILGHIEAQYCGCHAHSAYSLLGKAFRMTAPVAPSVWDCLRSEA